MTSQTHARAHRRFAPVRNRSILRRLLDMAATRRQRLHLARLDDQLLRDIGISRDAAEHEASKPVWDAPAHWTK